MNPIVKGDYVLASVWADGDSRDPWCVGFYEKTLHMGFSDRHIIVDAQGKPFRASGYRRMKRITTARGQWLLDHAEEIEDSGRLVWDFLRVAMQQKGEQP